jgi:hypothetical protein
LRAFESGHAALPEPRAVPRQRVNPRPLSHMPARTQQPLGVELAVHWCSHITFSPWLPVHAAFARRWVSDLRVSRSAATTRGRICGLWAASCAARWSSERRCLVARATVMAARSQL